MAGLFDNLYNQDPNNQANLALAAGLLSGRGNLNNVMGGALLGGQKQYLDFLEAQRRNELIQSQIASQQSETDIRGQQLIAARQQQADQDAVRKFWADPANYMRPSAQAPGDYAPGEAPQIPGGVMGAQGVAQRMLASGSPALAQTGYAGLQKSVAPTTVKSGETLGVWDAGTGKFSPSYTGPKETAPTQLADLIAERAKLPPGSPLAKLYDDAIAKATTHQPPIATSNVSVSMDKGFGEAFAKKSVERIDASATAAQASANSIGTLQRMQSAIDSGAIAGPGSKFKVFGLQLGNMLGVSGETGDKKLAATRELVQGAASLGLDGAKAMQGQGQISNYERELVQRASTGDIDSMTALEFRKLIDVLGKVHGSTIARHNKMLENVDPQFKPFVPFYQINAPQPSQATPQQAPTIRYQRNPQTGVLEQVP